MPALSDAELMPAEDDAMLPLMFRLPLFSSGYFATYCRVSAEITANANSRHTMID